MGGVGYIALAALILMLLPAVVLPWEGRRVPDALYAAIGAGGLVAAGLREGLDGVIWAAVAGAGSLLTVTAVIAGIKAHINAQLVTGGHIRLLAAGSTWLGIYGAMAMLGLAFAALFTIGLYRHRKTNSRRPDFAAIAALAILFVGIQQIIPHEESATARAATLAK